MILNLTTKIKSRSTIIQLDENKPIDIKYSEFINPNDFKELDIKDIV